MKRTSISLTPLIGGFVLGLVGADASAQTAMAEMKNVQGATVGIVMLTETPQGVLLRPQFKGLQQGRRAMHIHAVGKCEPPFTSAGGHFNPDTKKHGLISPEGMHAGDMPNIHVPHSGSLEVEVLNNRVSLKDGAANSLFDVDGAALIVHAGEDDYRTDPTGEAGGRVACGVVTRQ